MSENNPVVAVVGGSGLLDLYKALFLVQGKLQGVTPDSVNSNTQSRYPSQHAVMQALRPMLQEAKLLVMQFPLHNEDMTRIGVTQKVIHVDSGQGIEDTYWLPAPNNHPQAHAAIISYLGRYLLKARFMVTSKEDDEDGNVHGVPAPGLAVAATVVGDASPPTEEKPAVDSAVWAHPETGQQFQVSPLTLRQLERMPGLPLANLDVAEADAKSRLTGPDLEAFSAAIEHCRKQLSAAPQESVQPPQAVQSGKSTVPVARPNLVN